MNGRVGYSQSLIRRPIPSAHQESSHNHSDLALSPRKPYKWAQRRNQDISEKICDVSVLPSNTWVEKS